MRADRQDVRDMTAFLNDRPTRLCVMAERGLLAGLDGGCQVPIGGHATLDRDTLSLVGMVAEPDGSVELRRLARGTATDDADADALGRALAEELLEAGGRRILEKLYAG